MGRYFGSVSCGAVYHSNTRCACIRCLLMVYGGHPGRFGDTLSRPGLCTNSPSSSFHRTDLEPSILRSHQGSFWPVSRLRRHCLVGSTPSCDQVFMAAAARRDDVPRICRCGQLGVLAPRHTPEVLEALGEELNTSGGRTRP